VILANVSPMRHRSTWENKQAPIGRTMYTIQETAAWLLIGVSGGFMVGYTVGFREGKAVGIVRGKIMARKALK